MPNTTRRCQIGRCPNYAQPDGRFCDYHAQDGTGIARHHATGIAPHLAPDLETARKIAHDFTFYPGTNAGGNRHFNPTTSYAIESELLLSLSRNRNSGYDPQNPQTSSDYPSYSYTPQGNVAIAPQPTPDPSTNEGMAEIFDPPTTNQNQPSSYGTSGHVLQSTSTSVGSSGNPVMNTGSTLPVHDLRRDDTATEIQANQAPALFKTPNRLPAVLLIRLRMPDLGLSITTLFKTLDQLPGVLLIRLRMPDLRFLIQPQAHITRPVEAFIWEETAEIQASQAPALLETLNRVNTTVVRDDTTEIQASQAPALLETLNRVNTTVVRDDTTEIQASQAPTLLETLNRLPRVLFLCLRMVDFRLLLRIKANISIAGENLRGQSLVTLLATVLRRTPWPTLTLACISTSNILTLSLGEPTL
ncbi:hypothetical protein F4778DRAFT_779027 [Xylariomycetidae sp. FL2044]|nr:hypothetical protein F4778DRAFT_779027 [Xylariomycetidae sp. FL2044]